MHCSLVGGLILNQPQERRPTRITDRQNATMMLVGDVANRLAILVDDLADTSNTITRAAKLLKKEGATKVYALLTHGVLSGDAIERINASALDKVVVTNSVPQEENKKRCPKLEVLEIGTIFAEVGRIPLPPHTKLINGIVRQSDESIMEKVLVSCSSTTDNYQTQPNMYAISTNLNTLGARDYPKVPRVRASYRPFTCWTQVTLQHIHPGAAI